MNTPIDRAAFRFFHAWAGGIVGQQAVTATALARAERRARDLGLSAVWEWDDAADLGDHEYWCPDARREAAGYTDGRTYPHAVFRRYFGREPRKRTQAGEYIGRRAARKGHDHEVYSCVIYLPDAVDGRDRSRGVLASLYGILDPSREYRRIVEAELYAEALDEYDRLIGESVYWDGDPIATEAA